MVSHPSTTFAIGAMMATYSSTRSTSSNNGDDLRRDPLDVRKATLRSMLTKVGHGIRWNEHIEGDGATIFRHACKLGLEGIVSKRKDSPYRSGRSPDLAQDEEPKRTDRKARRRGGLGKRAVTELERKHLVETDRHIAECKNYIAKQRELIERAIQRGRSTEVAETTLEALETSLREFERQRRLLLDRLKERER